VVQIGDFFSEAVRGRSWRDAGEKRTMEKGHGGIPPCPGHGWCLGDVAWVEQQRLLERLLLFFDRLAVLGACPPINDCCYCVQSTMLCTTCQCQMVLSHLPFFSCMCTGLDITEGHAAIEMAILDFYEDAAIISSTLSTSDDGGGRSRGDCSGAVQVLPSVGPTYRLLFSGNALAVSRICGVCSSFFPPHSHARSSCLGLASRGSKARLIGACIHCVFVKVLSRSRERLQRARRLPLASPAAVHGTATGVEGEGPSTGGGVNSTEALVGLYNKYLMDFCNCLWRCRALPTTFQVRE
jgi:hypothetical protein